jgi:hypothetical protein
MQLLKMSTEGKTLTELFNLLVNKGEFRIQAFKSQLDNQLNYGLMELTGTRYTLTADGHAELSILDSKLIQKANAALPRSLAISKECYDGAELRRNCLRQGAYDAYDKPSLINRQTSTQKEDHV